MLWQPALPERYYGLTPAALAQAIAARKRDLGRDLIILGHHYQQDDIIRHADYTGDSLKLSQTAARRVREVGAKFVVFCGVHFMAESADVLAPEGTVVILPDLAAGCSMADMADYEDTLLAWREIHRDRPPAPGSPRVVPICYVNSTAAIKAFCGERGGAACTSSNCRQVFQWALAGAGQPLRPGERVQILFLPDQHLGRNTAEAMGFDVGKDMVLWDPRAPGPQPGGCTPEDLRRATFILWKGHCSVHMLFRAEHVDAVRRQWPDVTVIVHPECRREVVRRADRSASTEGIIQALAQAAPGSRWAVGTEVHLVHRLAAQAKERGVTVRMLSECQCLCTTMYRIDPPHLLWVLDELAAGRVVNQVRVPPEARKWAGVTLERMLALTAPAGAARD